MWVAGYPRDLLGRTLSDMPKKTKTHTHAKILKVAARRFRELGLEGIGVADLMRQAGVTVGAFYKHFKSRDELVVEALGMAFKDLDAWEEHAETLPQVLENYLSEAQRDDPGTGCAMGALLGDMSHASKSAKTVYTARVKRSLVFTAACCHPKRMPTNGAAHCSSSAVYWGRSTALGPSRTRSYRAKFSTRSASSSSI